MTHFSLVFHVVNQSFCPVEIIGAVIDVEFPSSAVPDIYAALHLREKDLTLEVQQQLGDGEVLTIAMGQTDGLRRQLKVTDTGHPIQVPVGKETLGRIMNVLGEAIDEQGPVDAEKMMPIHRAAPQFSELSASHIL